MKFKLEDNVNDFVKRKLESLGLKNGRDFGVESSMSDYLKEALKGSAKTKTKINFGKPDFHIERYKIPVLIENKLGLNKLIAKGKDGIKFDDESVKSYAVNGALHYARSVIASGKYTEAIAIGIAGDDEQNTKIQVYFVYGASELTIKFMSSFSDLNFLENKVSFANFLNEAKLTEREKHELLLTSNAYLKEQAKKLNKLMHDHNITAPQRVLYVSGMLLAMQDLHFQDSEFYGLTPEDLSNGGVRRQFNHK